MTNAYDRDAEPIGIDDQLDPFDPLDAGYIQASNYWMRFWWPFLKTPAATLYLQILVYSRRGETHRQFPSLRTLASTLGVDRRSFYGRTVTNATTGQPKHYPGSIATLEDAQLLVVALADDGPRWRFHIRRRPPLLTPEQAAQLPDNLRRAHADWLSRHIQNISSTVVHTTPPVAPTTYPVAHATQTITTTSRHEQGEFPAEEIAISAIEYTDAIPVRHSLAALWEDVRHQVAEQLTPTERGWIALLRPVSLADGVLTVAMHRDDDDTLTMWETHGAHALSLFWEAWPTQAERLQLITPAAARTTARRFQP